MELNSAESLARQLMKEHGLTDWHFRWSSALEQYGSCSHRTKPISLSKRLTPLCEEHQVRDTILHEIAHALVDHWRNHDEVWRAMALQIGCSGKRNGKYGTKAMLQYEYGAVCKNGHIVYSHRRLVGRSCGECFKGFNPEYILVFRKIESEQ